MSLDDHRQAFAATMAVLLSEFNAYLDRPGADPYADKIGYRQGVIWLSDEEITEAAGALQRALGKIAENGPRPGRRPRLISLIQFPTAGPSGNYCDGLPDQE
ncbi:hypothetical protein [Nocardia sp. NPDC046763]|uniref:hypothetical protein n=1 Tax=Nocardia sp. NPDC046763 TaxID=3155256 RepID=UPI0033DE6A12